MSLQKLVIGQGYLRIIAVLGIIVSIAAIFTIWAGCENQTEVTTQMATLKAEPFPKGIIQCRAGDYIVHETSAFTWEVFLVEDIVLLNRLVPLQIGGEFQLVEQRHIMDSATPEGMTGIYFLVTLHSQSFASSFEAIEEIKQKRITQSTHDIVMDIHQFTTENSLVYSSQK